MEFFGKAFVKSEILRISMTEVKLWISYDGECDYVYVETGMIISDVVIKCLKVFNLTEHNRINVWMSKTKSSEWSKENPNKIMKSTVVGYHIMEPNYAGSNENNPIFLHVETKRKRTKMYHWIDNHEQQPFLKKRNPFNIPPEDAFKALTALFESNFDKTINLSDGRWIFPIMDNMPGFGKSKFAFNYLQQVRKAFPYHRTKFQDALFNAKKLPVQLWYNCLDRQNPSKSLAKIIVSRCKQNINGSLPILEKEYNCSKILLEELVKEFGPIYLIIDEIDAPFISLKQIDTDFFWEFLLNVVRSWFNIPNLFFVLTGHRIIVRTMPPFLPDYGESFPFMLERIPLYPFSLNDIKVILKETLHSEEDPRKLVDYYGISDSELEKTAQRLLDQSVGIPRGVIEMLYKCETLKSLECYQVKMYHTEKQIIINHIKKFQEDINYFLKNYQTTLIDLTQSGNNLSDINSVSLHQIAFEAGFTWSGPIDSATIHLPNHIRMLIIEGKTLIELLDDYIYRKIFLDFKKCFEFFCYKRFLDMFSTACCPGKTFPQYFADSFFGNSRNVCFDQDALPFPQVTESGIIPKSYQRYSIFCNKTIHTDYVNVFLQEALDRSPISLLSLDGSYSPDAIFISKANNREIKYNIVLGLCVRKSSVQFTKLVLHDEAFKFTNMFKKMETTNLFKTLIVCATNYSQEIHDEFDGNGSIIYSDYKCDNGELEEVIILNLSNETERREFFGVENQKNAKYASALENMIDKTVFF